MPGTIIVDGADGGDYSGVRLPDNWQLRVAPVRLECGGRMEDYFTANPDAAFYSIVNDDVVPETPGWDVELAREAGDWNVAYPFDTLTDMATQFMVGGELARAVGSFSLGFLHTMVDRAWMDIGRGINRLVFRQDIRLRHEHWSRRAAPKDRTYERRYNGMDTRIVDRQRYESWKRDEYPALIARLREAIPA